MTLRHYRLGSLKAASAYDLTIFPDWTGDDSLPADIVVAPAPVPEQLKGADNRRRWFEACRGEALLLRYPALMRVLVTGEGAAVATETEANSAEIVRCLLGPVQAALWYLRGQLPLHGSAVMANGRAVVILGKSGAGKSTLAAALATHWGGNVVADDTCVIDLSGDIPMVRPTTALSRLWPDSARALGLVPERLPPAPGFKDKVLAGERNALPHAALPMNQVLVLEADGEISGFTPLTIAQAVVTVFTHIQKPALARALFAQSDLLALAGRLCHGLPVIRINRFPARDGAVITENVTAAMAASGSVAETAARVSG